MKKRYYFACPNDFESEEDYQELVKNYPGLEDGGDNLGDIIISLGVNFTFLKDRDYGFEAMACPAEVKKLPHYIYASAL